MSDAKTGSNYSTYGVLYNWVAAMAGAASSSTSPSNVQGVCPTGWHLPSLDEWTTLESYVDSHSAGKVLQASSDLWVENSGTDAYGFSALPGGNYGGLSFASIGYYGYWWTSTAPEALFAYGWSMSYGFAGVNTLSFHKDLGFSIRCLKN